MDRQRFYIGGRWVAPHGQGSFEVVNANTEEVMARVPRGNRDDADRAVAAARTAFGPWAARTPAERAKDLQRVSEGLQARTMEIARSVAAEVGMPLSHSMVIQAGFPILTFGSMEQLVHELAWEERVGNSLVVREPAGVAACITPWNYPLHQVAAKVAPALAAGCTVVLKPSEVAPLTAFLLAEVIDEVGLPPGVFNLVTGPGPEVGEALVSSTDVDLVSFTGSTEAGKRVAELAAGTVKRVTLELGGKSPNLILDDADLEKAVPAGVAAAFLNCGQTCVALSRMIVPRRRLGEVEALAVGAAESYVPGNAFDDDTRIGPLASEHQRRRVLAYIDEGLRAGARLLTGGSGPPDAGARGYYVRPTVFSDVQPDMTIAREEIFGPVLSIIPYDTEDEGIAIANDSPYGLAGAVWAGSEARALAVARRLRAGQVEVNGGGFNLLAPFGGYKQSGIGRELGRYGLEEFLEIKSIQL